MIQKTWWDYFDEDPYEKTGRYVTGLFGHPVIVSLARISWAYLDWYVEQYGGDVGKFFRINIEGHDPRECNVDEWMEGAVRLTYLGEEREGRPRPEWCPAANPAEYMDI